MNYMTGTIVSQHIAFIAKNKTKHASARNLITLHLVKKNQIL